MSRPAAPATGVGVSAAAVANTSERLEAGSALMVRTLWPASASATAGFRLCPDRDLFATHRVERVGVEGTASWGQHVAIALVAAGLDVREVPAQRSAQQRRARRLAKTDVIDATAAARALLAEPTLGPAQALEIYDPRSPRSKPYSSTVGPWSRPAR